VEHFFDWFRRCGEPGRPWLILGKGPSFALRERYDLSRFHLLSLNHAVREQAVLLAHMIDLDVVDACGEALPDQAEYLVLPWYPHVRNAPGARSLEDLVPGHPVLRRMAGQGRLLWYDLSTAPRRFGPGPVVRATYFSAEAAVNLLGLAGVRQVRSLGVDGGAGYSADFEDLARRTLLANGQPGFDLQFQGIARTIQRTGLDFAPLDQPAPMVVCVRSSTATSLAERVLEYSLRKNASISVRMHAIRSPADPARIPSEHADEWHVAPGTERRAIVIRAEALVFGDLRQVWLTPRLRPEVAAPGDPEGSRVVGDAPPIALVTGSGADWLETVSRISLGGSLARPEFPGGLPVAALPGAWGRRDRFVEGDTALLLYAAPETRPWVSRAHPLAHLWVSALIEAVREGAITLESIQEAVRQGHVRPSLLEQVDRGTPEDLFLSWSARRRDAEFRLREGLVPVQAGMLPHPMLALRALARHARRRLGAYRGRSRTIPE
jgi:hypothetical protein